MSASVEQVHAFVLRLSVGFPEDVSGDDYGRGARIGWESACKAIDDYIRQVEREDIQDVAAIYDEDADGGRRLAGAAS